jgi:hypothetical protein
MRIMIAIRALVLLAAMLVGATSVQAQAVSGQGTWETTLLGRDIGLNAVAATDASAVYLYDATLNVTWLRNANVNGATNWNTAMTWASNLTTGSGATVISDWRLPTMADPATVRNWSYGGTNAGYNVAPSSGEMASLFFSTLGNKSHVDTSGVWQPGDGLTNVGSFQNMQYDVYWLGTEYAPSSSDAWLFVTTDGGQNAGPKIHPDNQFYALAVRNGDVAPVPEPETYAMLLAGLGLIGAIARRRHSDKTLVAQS